MKRVLMLTLAGVLTLSMAACCASPETAGQSAAPAETSEEPSAELTESEEALEAAKNCL